MRLFKFAGKQWVAQIHDGHERAAAVKFRVGWEAIQFDSQPPGQTQRITYRPSGWLHLASLAELIDALREGDSVRAAWRR